MVPPVVAVTLVDCCDGTATITVADGLVVHPVNFKTSVGYAETPRTRGIDLAENAVVSSTAKIPPKELAHALEELL
jgi:hypothetical protein